LTGEPDRLSGQVRTVDVQPRGGGIALVEDEVEHVITAAICSSRSSGGGMPNVAPASRMDCLARLTLWAMVASGTKKAPAISAVLSPPTTRKGQRDLRRRSQRRMAAQQQQDEGIVSVVVAPVVEVLKGPSWRGAEDDPLIRRAVCFGVLCWLVLVTFWALEGASR
jgi:hypothetical protein